MIFGHVALLCQWVGCTLRRISEVREASSAAPPQVSGGPLFSGMTPDLLNPAFWLISLLAAGKLGADHRD
jgi:hypothetical protein